MTIARGVLQEIYERLLACMTDRTDNAVTKRAERVVRDALFGRRQP
ncbi:MAG: hypothetical protein ACM358_05630 [Gemmatimonadota bacterium]